MNLPRKINIFGMELSTEGAVTEKPFAEVPFFLNKTQISGDAF